MLCLLVFGVGTSWAEAYSGTFNKITTTAALTTGKYVIVGGATANAMGAYSTFWASTALGSAINSGKTVITNPDATVVWDITKDGSNYIISQTSGGTTKYVGFTGTSNNNNSFGTTNTDNKTKFTASVSSGTFTFTNVNYNTRKLQYNSSSPRFSNYSGQTGLTIFQLQNAGTPVAKPTNLSAGTPTSTGTTLSWDAVDHATAYKVEYKVSSAGAWTTVSPNPTTNSCTISGLTPSTTYAWQVTALSTENGYTNGSAQAGANFTTAAPASHKAYFYVNGALQNAGGTDFTEGASITFPADPEEDGVVFVGWTEISDYSHATDAPSDLCKSATMGDDDVTYYAVFATASAGGAEPTAYTAGETGSYVLAVYNDSKWYALPNNPTVNSGKITGVEITVSTSASSVNYVTSSNASGYIWTIANATNGQTISDGTNYIYHSNGGASGTNLAYGNSTSYTWKIESEANGLTFKGMSGSTVNSRGMLASGTSFGGYALSNEDASGYNRIQVLPIGGGTTYSDYCTTVTTKTLTSIAVKTAPTKVIYTEDEMFDPAGLVITATYDDESAEDIAYASDPSAFSFDPSLTTALTPGNQSVTITYEEKQTTQAITVNAIPTYTLTITQPTLGGVLTVKNGDVALESGASVRVGTNLTCEVTEIPAGKRFSRFYVRYDDDGEKYKATNPATFDNLPTEGITAAEVIVAYQDIQYYTINYMVNGVNTNPQVNVEEQTPLVFPAVSEINGKSFVGWVEDAIDGVTQVEPSFVSTTGLKAIAPKTYHAVFATMEGDGDPNTLTPVTGSITSGDYYLVDTYEGVDANNSTAPKYWAVNGGLNGTNGATGGFVAMDISNKVVEADGNLTSINLTGVPSANWPSLYTITVEGNGVAISRKISETLTETYYCTGANVNADMTLTETGNYIWNRIVEGTEDNAGRYSIEVDHGTGNRCLLFYEHTNTPRVNRTFKNQARTNRGAGGAQNEASYGSGYFYFLKAGSASYSNYTTAPYGTTDLSVTSAGWGTYYNADAYVMPAGMEGYIMKEVGGSIKSVKAYEEGDVVPAETALLLKNEGDYTFYFTTCDDEKPEGNLLHGNLEAGPTTGGGDRAKYYKLANGENGLGWYYGSSDNIDGRAFNIAANKAYLVIESHLAPAYIGLEDDEDAIMAMPEETKLQGDLYNVAGQKVSKNYKGIVIVNGKKMLNK